jgi:hypothetical protein
MDLQIIKTFFNFGKLFALTPPSPDSTSSTLCQKLFVLLMFSACTVGTLVSFYYRGPQYAQLVPIKAVLWLATDMSRYYQSFYTLIVVMLFKRNRWSQLVENLKKLESKSTNSHRFLFVAAHLSFCLLLGTMNFVCVTSFGSNCIKLYHSEYYQFYSQFFYMLFSYTVLRLLVARYRYQRTLLKQKIMTERTRFTTNLEKIRCSLITLKETVDIYNDIFGTVTLLNIFFISGKTLVYFDNIVKRETAFKSNRRDGNLLLYFIQSGVMTIFWVRFMPVKISFCYVIAFRVEQLQML